MLTAHQVSKTFQTTPLFQKATFSINPHDRIGLVGPNGSGKTTLLRILTGEETPTQGAVTRDANLRIGYLQQGFTLSQDQTIGQVLAKAIGSAEALEAELINTTQQLTARPQDAALQQQYDDLLHRIQAAEPGRVGSIRKGLGLDQVPEDQLVSQLSGGQKTRLALALVLLGDPQVLLLDEPTNHLDIGMLEWLEDWLKSVEAGVLIVSHDRTFLDHVVNQVIEIDPLTRQVKNYAGNYSAYVEQRQKERDALQAEYQDQQAYIQQMRQDIAATYAQAAHSEQATIDSKMCRYAKKVARKATSRRKRLEQYINSDERVEKPLPDRKMRFAFGELEHRSQYVLTLQDGVIGYSQEQPAAFRCRCTCTARQTHRCDRRKRQWKDDLAANICRAHPAAGRRAGYWVWHSNRHDGAGTGRAGP